MTDLVNNSFIMDCSTTMSLLFADEDSVKAVEMALFQEDCNVIVPPLWFYEVSNTLCTALKSKRIEQSEVIEIKILLAALKIQVDEPSAKLAWSHVLDIACSYGLTSYDAAYLELSLRRQLPLATLDKGLQKAAKKSGVLLIS
jgi:predicted nucleic acid-binding protein